MAALADARAVIPADVALTRVRLRTHHAAATLRSGFAGRTAALARLVASASRWRASAIVSAVTTGLFLEIRFIGCGAVLRTRAMQPPSITSESFLAGIPHHRSPGTFRAVPVCCSQSNSKGVREPEPGTASGSRALRASILSATFPQPPGAALACARAGFVAPASRWRAASVGDSPDRPVLPHEATGPQSADALPTPVQALLRSSLPPVPFTSRPARRCAAAGDALYRYRVAPGIPGGNDHRP